MLQPVDKRILGDQDARILEHLSCCVTIAGCGHRARSAVLRGQRSLADLQPIRRSRHSAVRHVEPGRAGQARRGLRCWDALRLGLWSNAGVFVRVWECEVPGDRAEAFTAACAADSGWGVLFGRAAGFLGTQLYRDAARADRFLTIDRCQDEQNWRSFLNAFGSAYEASTPNSRALPPPDDRCPKDPPSRLRRRHRHQVLPLPG